MKLNKTLTTLIAGAAFGLSGHVMAAGTLSGTSITNTVTLDYQVSGIDQDQKTESAEFDVDARILYDLTLQETTAETITPNGNGYLTTFLLSNGSNEALDFDIASSDLADGTVDFLPPGQVVDNIDLNANITLYVESGTTAGYQAAEDTDTTITALDVDNDINIYAVVTTDVPATLEDGDIAAIELTVTPLQVGGAAIPDNSGDSFDPLVKHYVIENTSLAVNTAYEVASANLSIAKTVNVISDPVNNTTNPKAIPGAVVEFTITVENTGSTSATTVIVSDDLNMDTDPDGAGPLTADGVNDFDLATISTPTVDNTGLATPANAPTVSSGVVSVEFPEIASGESSEITFQVELN